MCFCFRSDFSISRSFYLPLSASSGCFVSVYHTGKVAIDGTVRRKAFIRGIFCFFFCCRFHTLDYLSSPSFVFAMLVHRSHWDFEALRCDTKTRTERKHVFCIDNRIESINKLKENGKRYTHATAKTHAPYNSNKTSEIRSTRVQKARKSNFKFRLLRFEVSVSGECALYGCREDRSVRSFVIAIFMHHRR